MSRYRVIVIMSLAVVLGVAAATLMNKNQPPADNHLLIDGESVATLAALAADYNNAVARALQAQPPVLVYLPLTPQQQQAVQVALGSGDFLRYTVDEKSKQPFRTEIVSVRPVKSGDLPAGSRQLQLCTSSSSPCQVVELYNFGLNALSLAVVDGTNQVVLVQHLMDMQPEVPKHLTDIAYQVAADSSELRARLGRPVAPAEFVMGGTKTALTGSTCDRSRTLCVAATLVADRRAYWVIVNLRDLQLVGIKETRWEDENPAPLTPSETQLRDAVIMNQLCFGAVDAQEPGSDGRWKFRHQLTNSDGTLFEGLSYHGTPLLRSAKNVDWHVSYSGTDGFGYSDAIGCPLFSAAAVVPAELPKWKAVTLPSGVAGHEFHQDFLSRLWPIPCNYYYENRLQLFDDGSFRVAVASVGRGCGDNGTYRPVVRLTFPGTQRLERYIDGGWKKIAVEEWFMAGTERSPSGGLLRINNSTGSVLELIPGDGQFGDGGRGDNPFFYITKIKAEEGESDLPTIGPCCNEDYRQGPEKFLNKENVDNEAIALWYVPQLKNDGRKGSEYCWGSSKVEDGIVKRLEFPCVAGPLFKQVRHE